LGLYLLGAGGVLAARLKAEYRGESLSDAPGRKKASASRMGAEASGAGWLLDGSGPMAAVIEKEIRTLLRTLPLLYAIGAPLVLVFVFATMYHNTTSRSGLASTLALPLAMA